MQLMNRIFLIIGLGFIIFLCSLTIRHIYHTNIVPDKYAKQTFQNTPCLLISKRLTTRGNLIPSYRADFLISYEARGVQYNHWVAGNGLDNSFSTSSASQGDLLSRYEVGKSYTCYFDPTNPQKVFLIERHNWRSTFPIFLPAVLIIISLYYLFKYLFLVLIDAHVKTREVWHRRKKKKK